ncbi:MAG: hypothetical protein OXC31_13900 [Spirochaetaceae bacterium]|nr:hypothetical protein [Spirochaetaceae bacterium]
MNGGEESSVLRAVGEGIGRWVREREVLRVVATVDGTDSALVYPQAIKETLVWAENRAGGDLPENAWAGEEFEKLAGGRSVLATALKTEEGALWALRAEDPDKSVPGRVWTTEVTVGQPEVGPVLMSVRLLASSHEAGLEISPHVPGLVQQIVDECGVSADGVVVATAPHGIETEGEAERLIGLLENPRRRLPVIVASGDERGIDAAAPLINADSLAVATLGLAHVVVVPARLCYALSAAFGRVRSVFHGGVRVYMSEFDSAADPYEHRLFLGQDLRLAPEVCETEVRRIVASESLRRTRLGHDVLAFAAVRSEVVRRETNKTANASNAEQLLGARRQIEALEHEVGAARAEADQNFELAAAEEDRARNAEAIQHGLRARVQTLEEALSQRDIEPDAGLQVPCTWQDMSDWCDEVLAGRLVLASQARRGVKKAAVEEPKLAAGCLVWLSSTSRKRRIHGGGNLGNIPIREGILNASCGGDEFEFEWQHRKLVADWHIKNGGNTRDRRRCLRIYYCFDEVTQQVVVADMPAHRRTDAT